MRPHPTNVVIARPTLPPSRTRRTRPTAILTGVLGLAAAAGAQPDNVSRLYETCTPAYPTGAGCGSVAIPDFPGGPVELTLVVPSDADGNIIQEVAPLIWIQHTFQGDLTVDLVSPAGTVVRLLNRPGVPATINGFSADDFGGFRQCLPPLMGGSFQAMFFRDQGFNVCTFSNYVTNPYTTPAVAAPGIAFTPPILRDCTTLPCGGDSWGPWAPTSPLSVLAGESKAGTWRLRVQDMANGDTGSIRYLGLNIRTLTQPKAIITTPTQFSCVCNGAQIIGTASDAGGFIQSYDLEYSASPLGPWSLINTSATQVVNGVLGTWNTGPVSEGQTFLRLTVTNADGSRSQFTTVAFVDKSFDGLGIGSPVNGAIVGGLVCPKGSITEYCFQNYRVDYAPGPLFNNYQPVDPSMAVYTIPVTNDRLATWNTQTGGAAVVDGDYRLRFRGTTNCGNAAEVFRNVTVDNTAPIAFVGAPTACNTLCGTVQVVGTVSDAHLSSWVLQYTGGDSHSWVTISSGTTNVINGTLANWNTSALKRCAYVLRLIASDQSVIACGTSSNTTEYTVSVNIGAYSNCDSSTLSPTLNVNDFVCFLNKYAMEAGCPQ